MKQTQTLSVLKELLLPKSSYLNKLFPCMNKNDYFIMETNTLGYILVWIIYTSHTDNFTPKHTAFEHTAASLSRFRVTSWFDSV